MQLRHKIVVQSAGTATYDVNNNPVLGGAVSVYTGECEFQDAPRGNRVNAGGDEANTGTVVCYLPNGEHGVTVDMIWSDPDTGRSGRVLRSSSWRGMRYTKLNLQEL